MYWYMRSYRDWKYTSRVPLHAVLQRLEIYFTCSTTCGLTEIGNILHAFQYMRSYRVGNLLHVPLYVVVLHRLEMYFTCSITLFLICVRLHVVEHEAQQSCPKYGKPLLIEMQRLHITNVFKQVEYKYFMCLH